MYVVRKQDQIEMLKTKNNIVGSVIMIKEFLEENIEDYEKEYKMHIENHHYAEARITYAKYESYKRVLDTINALEHAKGVEINL